MDGIIIKKLILVRSNPVPPQVKRPHTLHLTNNTLDKITSVVSVDGPGTNRVSDYHISKIFPDIIRPSSGGQVADIINGWSSERFRFILVVEITKPNDLDYGERYYVQGYSDYFEASFNGTIDPNITLYINSVTQTQLIHDTYHNYFIENIVNSYNMYTKNIEPLNPIRPIDISIGINLLPNDQAEGLSHGLAYSNDFTSRKSNNSSVKYLTKTLNAYLEPLPYVNSSYQNNNISDYASLELAEPIITANAFLRSLGDFLGKYVVTYFSIGDLIKIDPHLLDDPNRCIMFINKNNSNTISDGLSNTLSPTIESITSYEIINSITDLASSYFVTELVVSFSSRKSFNHEPLVVVTKLSTMIPNNDEIKICKYIESYIRTILLPKIEKDASMAIEASVNYNMVGESYVMLGVNDSPMETFLYPSYADSLYSPILGTQYDYNSTVEDFSNLLMSMRVFDNEQDFYKHT